MSWFLNSSPKPGSKDLARLVPTIAAISQASCEEEVLRLKNGCDKANECFGYADSFFPLIHTSFLKYAKDVSDLPGEVQLSLKTN